MGARFGCLLSGDSGLGRDGRFGLNIGLAGLALVVLGAAVFLRYSFGQFLRFWLLRLSAEIQQGAAGATATSHVAKDPS